jgi:hypothetical protein
MKTAFFIFFIFSSSVFSQSNRERLEDIQDKLDELELQRQMDRSIDLLRRQSEETRRQTEELQRQRQNSQSSSCQNIKNMTLMFNRADFCMYLDLSSIKKINKSNFTFQFFHTTPILSDTPVRHYYWSQEREINCSNMTSKPLANIYYTLDNKTFRESINGFNFEKVPSASIVGSASKFICR